jgi:multiple sugar transport system permease protein
VAALFSFVFVWNEFIYALILTRIKAQTIPIQISSYAGVKGVEWGKMMALSTLSSLPGIILAIFLQKHLVSGLTLGAVKE